MPTNTLDKHSDDLLSTDHSQEFRPQLAERAESYSIKCAPLPIAAHALPYDFSVCRNPLGCSPRVAAALRSADFELAKYPPAKGGMLKEHLARYYGLASNNVAVGAAAEQLLHTIAELFVDQKMRVVVPAMTYPGIFKAVEKYAGNLVKTPLNAEMQIDLSEMKQQILLHDSSLAFVCNPNNPTGHLLSRKDILDFVSDLPNVVVLVDEAAIEFSQQDESVARDIAGYPNLIVVKTFSKGYGLASLRVGYLLASSEIVRMLEQRSIYRPLNEIGEKMACLALEDRAFLQTVQDFVANERERIISAMAELGVKVFDSVNNNLLIHVDRVEEVISALADKGVMVKPGSTHNYAPADSCFRLSIQDQEKNSYFISQMQSIFSGFKF